MITEWIEKKELMNHLPGIHSTLSFRLFFDDVKNRLLTEKTVKKNFYEFILTQAELHPEWKEEIAIDRIKEYEVLFDLVYASLFAPLSDEGEVIWGLSLPINALTFYSTDILHKLLTKERISDKRISLMLPDKKELHQHFLNEAYLLILERVYAYPVFTKGQLIHAYREEDTGLMKQLQIDLDLRFVQVNVKGGVPELLIPIPPSEQLGEMTLQLLQESLPLDLFHFEGFSVISARDATEAFALESIRDAMALPTFELPDAYARIFMQFQSLLGTNKIHFGIIPFIKVNEQFALPYSKENPSHLISMANACKIPEEEFVLFLNQYHKQPQLLQYSPMARQEDMIAQIIHKNKINTFLVIPIFHRNQLVGILEMYSKYKDCLNQRSVHRLDHSLSLFAQLIYGTIQEITQHVDQVLKEEFTPIQPAVEWKFKEVVWNHILANQISKRKQSVERVYFNHVYPLYGAIDIRHSTRARSSALNKDLHKHFSILSEVFTRLSLPEKILNEQIHTLDQFVSLLDEPLRVEDENQMNVFVESDLNTFFNSLTELTEREQNVITDYSELVKDTSGVLYKNRHQLEKSMQRITSAVVEQTQLFQKNLQNLFPCYFDFFRTDGVEFDVYLGQSIAPRVTFRSSLLQEFRFAQLQFIYELTQLTHSLKDQMEVPLQTTQLIFVHNHTIDVSFRTDERRFDVEGSSNIRYQMLKKRIDKVCIKDTNERLTQPDTIAIVYADQEIKEEYKSYIKRMMRTHLIKIKVAYLDLEELQGVSGLKAIRLQVGI